MIPENLKNQAARPVSDAPLVLFVLCLPAKPRRSLRAYAPVSISFCLSQYISISHVPRYHKFCGKDLFRLFYKIFSQIGWDTIDPEGIKPVDLNGFGIQIILF